MWHTFQITLENGLTWLLAWRDRFGDAPMLACLTRRESRRAGAKLAATTAWDVNREVNKRKTLVDGFYMLIFLAFTGIYHLLVNIWKIKTLCVAIFRCNGCRRVESRGKQHATGAHAAKARSFLTSSSRLPARPRASFCVASSRSSNKCAIGTFG